MVDWPLDTITYVTEGLVAADLLLPPSSSAAAKGAGGVPKHIAERFYPTVDWLLRNQNADGSWGTSQQPADRQRSPRVVTLLSW